MRASWTLILLLACALPARGAEKADEEADWPRRLAAMETRDGLLSLRLEPARGRVWLELPAAAHPDGEIGTFLHVGGLVTGLGSNPVGLDRGQLGSSRLVRLRRLGDRLLIEELNPGFRAALGTPAEKRAVEESFATSVLWAGEVVHPAPDGRAWVDLTSFAVRDAHGVAARLRASGQGKYVLDAARSVLDPAACLAFPDNIELEAVLTWGFEPGAGNESEPGALVRSTAPTAEAITLVQHQSLVRLPDDGYPPRRFDPRAGSFAIGYADYAAALDEPLERRWIVRFRLEKTTPGEGPSPVRRPLVFHVDPAIPEPVRSAVIEGASWWREAFTAAGFEDAFRVELLPPDAHPLDVRYNVIQWVHRSTRGWSYGGGVIDPRTGERLKGHVSLGSLRVRQDRLLFEGLAGVERTGSGAPDDPVQLALARIRQLSAHEVGHTLGLAHNFAASTYAGRASVMDYPAPLVRLGADGELDFSAAYATGLGAWDLHAIRWAYSQVAPGVDEEAALEGMLREAREAGLLFLTDEDARPPGAAQPRASLWDNGDDPVARLGEEMAIRRTALGRFGVGNIGPGLPLALLEEVLAPVYFHHRYQLEAAAKVLGGLDYRHAVKGGPDGLVRPLPAAAQRRALDAVLATLDPAALDLPESILEVLLPRPFGHPRHRELFAGHAAPGFDPLAAAGSAAGLAVGTLLQPERAARLVDFHRRDPGLPGFDEVLRALVDRVFGTAPEPPRWVEIRRVVREVVTRRLVGLAGDPMAAPGVRFRAESALRDLAGRLEATPSGGEEGGAHDRYLAGIARRFLERGSLETAVPTGATEPPPGAPIGAPALPPPLTGCSSAPW